MKTARAILNQAARVNEKKRAKKNRQHNEA